MGQLSERKTAPFTEEESEQLALFVDPSTPEHEVLRELSAAPLRAGSEGSVIRALAMLGMRMVHERLSREDRLALGYAEMAESRGEADRATAAGMRRNMARLAREG